MKQAIFQNKVAGMQYSRAKDDPDLKVGEHLMLLTDVNWQEKHDDPNAVIIMHNNFPIGYVARKLTHIVRAIMGSGVEYDTILAMLDEKNRRWGIYTILVQKEDFEKLAAILPKPEAKDIQQVEPEYYVED